jgi:quercetin dioxygenase-like cupin family protein
MTTQQLPVIRNLDQITATRVERTRGATIQVLIGPEQGAPNFVTRCFTLAPGGRIPGHRHDTIEHQQMVLDGEMVLSLDGREHLVKSGDLVLIPAGVAHWYENRSKKPVRFLCIVPLTDDYQTEWLEPEP